jgi:putative ABC transport system permease protein
MLSATLALFLGVASTTALVVGGFVLSSIFYINIYTREWEIGLRRALGATKKEVMRRILAESVVVVVASVLVGSLLGVAAIKLILPSLKIPVVYPVKAFVLSALFSLAVALFSVYFPARKAAQFEPVKALRRKV